MRSAKIRCLCLFAIFTVYSCTKDIHVNLKGAASQIVIIGEVNNMDGPYQVKINTTVNFSASNTFPPVSGAKVKIIDNTSGQTDLLAETSPGIYITQALAQGVPGHAYQLYVLLGGQTYTATSTMPQPVNLDSITFDHSSDFGRTTINAVPNFQDPPGIANYYTFTEYINLKLFTKILFVFDDRLSDGRYSTQQLSMDSAYLQPGDDLQVQMRCVDKNVYNYYNGFADNLSAGGFQSATPSNPVSNISNNSLGYFSANTIQSKSVKVK